MDEEDSDEITDVNAMIISGSSRKRLKKDSGRGIPNVLLKNHLPQRLTCALCEQILRSPIQTARGELACEICYTENIKDNICPIDHEPILQIQFFKDRFKLEEVNRVECFCSYKSNGCTWDGTVRDLEDHLEICPWQDTECILCGDVICKESVPTHLKDCDKFRSLDYCFYAQYGCSYKPISVEDHLDHLQQDVWKHIILQNKNVQKFEEESKQLHHEYENMRKIIHEDTDYLNKQIEHLTKQCVGMQTSIERMCTSLEAAKCTSSDARKSEETVPDCSLNGLKRDLSAINNTIYQLNLTQQLYENTSFDGRMTWKVDNFNYRMQQAVTGEVTALHSAPCFTSKYGYKFCGRLYLNGDGMGKCTHLSLFIVLMKSEYDNLLEWPFTKRVTLRVINQEDSMKSMEESFVGDRFSSSFQKPSRELNVASGCPLLVPKDELINGGFVKDDCMFIEMSVL